MRVPWTAWKSNQLILQEISPKYSLEGLMLKLKLQYFGHLMQRTDSLEKTLMLGISSPSPNQLPQSSSLPCLCPILLQAITACNLVPRVAASLNPSHTARVIFSNANWTRRKSLNTAQACPACSPPTPKPVSHSHCSPHCPFRSLCSLCFLL